MTQTDLNRVQTDLKTIRDVIGIEPTSRENVWNDLALAALGAVTALWAAFGPMGHIREVFTLMALICAVSWATTGSLLRQKQGRLPGQWRRFRKELLATAIAVPLLGAFILWTAFGVIPAGRLTVEIWRNLLAAPAFFYVGVATLVYAITDRQRLIGLAAAVPLMLAGVALPLCETGRQMWGLVGVSFLLSGLIPAVVVRFQLRGTETPTH